MKLNFSEWIKANEENVISLYRDYCAESKDEKTTFNDFARYIFSETIHAK